MSVWTLLRCDYFNGITFCRRRFQTQYDWERALQEARTYGWSRSELGIRCSDHRDRPGEPLPKGDR